MFGFGTAPFSCRNCNGTMRKKTITEGRGTNIIMALIFIVIGVLLCMTVIGAIVGIPIIILSIFKQPRRRHVWRCNTCGSIIERA